MIINCFFLFADGPGTYTVVQCGAAGHNIRSKPNMKGCPLGRLSKGSIIGAIEEVRGTEEENRKREREQESKRKEWRKREGEKKQRQRETEQCYKSTCMPALHVYSYIYFSFFPLYTLSLTHFR